MRYYVLVILSGAVFGLVGGAPVSNDIEASGEAPLLLDQEEQPHQRLKFYSWDYKDLGTTAFDDVPFVARDPPAYINQTEKCADGWFRFSDSCYWIETELLGFANAERKCFEKQATLFVANSIDEWDAVRSLAKEFFFSWIGLVRFTHYEKTEQLPRWQTDGGIHPTKLSWLISPYKPIENGWSQLANCAASYKSSAKLETGSYTYYYPCSYMLYSICERNATITNSLQ